MAKEVQDTKIVLVEQSKTAATEVGGQGAKEETETHMLRLLFCMSPVVSISLLKG